MYKAYCWNKPVEKSYFVTILVTSDPSLGKKATRHPSYIMLRQQKSQASTTGLRPVGLGRPGLHTRCRPARSGRNHLVRTHEG